jgi:hypothetical protein
MLIIISLYILLLIFILTVIYRKEKMKEKIHPIWFCILIFLIMLPIIYYIVIGTFIAKGVSVTDG